MFGARLVPLPTRWLMRSVTTWVVCTIAKIQPGMLSTNFQPFVLASDGWRVGRVTKQLCPMIRIRVPLSLIPFLTFQILRFLT